MPSGRRSQEGQIERNNVVTSDGIGRTQEVGQLPEGFCISRCCFIVVGAAIPDLGYLVVKFRSVTEVDCTNFPNQIGLRVQPSGLNVDHYDAGSGERVWPRNVNK